MISLLFVLIQSNLYFLFPCRRPGRQCDLTRCLFIDSACFQLASQSRPSSTFLFSFLPCRKNGTKITPRLCRASTFILATGSLAVFPFYLFVFYIQALKVLRTAEYAPLVVFIAAPSMSALAELRSSINVSHPSYHNSKKKKTKKKNKHVHTYSSSLTPH